MSCSVNIPCLHIQTSLVDEITDPTASIKALNSQSFERKPKCSNFIDTHFFIHTYLTH